MGYQGRKAEMIYEFPDLLPNTDSTKIAYAELQKRFGKSGAILLVAIEGKPTENLEKFQAWYDLISDLKQIDGVDTVVSITSIFDVVKNSKEKVFEIKPVVTTKPVNENELIEIREKIARLPFYKGLLYNDSSGASLIALTLDSKTFHSMARVPLVQNIEDRVEQFKTDQNTEAYISGLPYIRTVVTEMIRKELGLFVGLSILITTLLLSIFFRSTKTVITSMTVVAIGVVWYFGVLGTLGYKITILTALIPPLLIVIGVPNCIFLINKFHSEFKDHQNKMKALSRVIEKIGNATLLTNFTTACGFFTFVFTQNPLLIEFGIVAFVSIMFIFIIAICVVPIFFSYFPEPKSKHSRHLDKKWIIACVNYFERVVLNHRSITYGITGLIIVISVYGMTLLKTTGNVVDDVPDSHKVVTDLRFFENHFNGVLPFEIAIDAKKPGYASKDHTLKKIDKLYKVLAEYDQFSRPLSVIDGIKFCKQAYYNGNPKKYQLINQQEKVFFKSYLENSRSDQQWLSAFIDTTKQYARISVQMKDIGTKEMEAIFAELNPKIDSIFSPDKYNVHIVGPSITFLRGTTFLIENLKISLALAVLIIAVIMLLLFRSWRMVIVSLIPNLIPLLVTGGVMGYFGIALKPSTILVFSIAFGISVDDTIHFLAKYRQELKQSGWYIKKSVLNALNETGISMMYTSIVLFFGFAVFMISDFGGTQALGILVSLTLLVAMVANLILLPSFLLTLDRFLTNRAFKEPLLEIIDEEEDIDLGNLTIKKDSPTFVKENQKEQTP
ncbi:MAG: MMPL family transporter [Flavobacteriales bacterium]|nr:MMPL family transporter [Flavobacteriales bacterium]